MFTRGVLFAIVAIAAGAISAHAGPTPVPGGANQVNALSGKIGDTVFNGDLRIKIVELRNATAADNPAQMLPTAGQKVMVLNVLLRNGMHSAFTDLLTYTLADKDDVTFEIPSNYLRPANLHIQQGGAARQTAMFVVDQNFVPVKLIVQCASCSKSEGFKAVRFTVPSP
jgi:hypothetical protein